MKRKLEEKSALDKANKRHLSHLARVHSTEELFFLLHDLEESKAKQLIEHYISISHTHKDHDKVKKVIKESPSLEHIKEKLCHIISNELIHEYLSLRNKISSLSKENDFVDMMSTNIPVKIKLFSLTARKKDYMIVKKRMHEVECILNKKPL